MPPSKDTKKVSPVKLGSVGRADGTAHTNLATQIADRFEYIRLYKDEDRKELLATVHAPDGEKVDSLGSIGNFILAIVDGAFGGTGQGPEGSARFVAENVDIVQKGTKNNIRNLWLEVIPQPGSRTSTKGYLAEVGSFVQMLQTKAAIAVRAEELYGLMRASTRAKKEEDEEVTVLL